MWEALRGKPVCVSQGSSFAKPLSADYGAVVKGYKSSSDSLLALRGGQCGVSWSGCWWDTIVARNASDATSSSVLRAGRVPSASTNGSLRATPYWSVGGRRSGWAKAPAAIATPSGAS
ncbi:hypothetical protein G6F50_016587 [Rhizopus delemar]|uniref:Uncharacterized protein n=1 Tax=Rhizopus delemar TaxID=936053 RepID=A0A9P7C1T9_9FUNG|nr:hypothetical protein G6F50_016587 [Rhizopus delemar]